eukprot:gene15479-biopygen18710
MAAVVNIITVLSPGIWVSHLKRRNTTEFGTPPVVPEMGLPLWRAPAGPSVIRGGSQPLGKHLAHVTVILNLNVHRRLPILTKRIGGRRCTNRQTSTYE